MKFSGEKTTFLHSCASCAPLRVFNTDKQHWNCKHKIKCTKPLLSDNVFCGPKKREEVAHERKKAHMPRVYIFIGQNYMSVHARETCKGERWPPLSFPRLSLARVLIILSYYVNKTAPDYHRSCSTGGFATRQSSNARSVAIGDWVTCGLV